MKPLALGLGLAALLPQAGGQPTDFTRGVAAYRETQFEDAHKLFAQAEQTHREQASPELLINRSLAALRIGMLEDAEFSAEKAAARGGPTFYGLRDFLCGHAAWIRCLRAEAETALINPEPSSFERALGHASLALSSWKSACTRLADWPAARRNVERCLLLIDDLKQRREEALKKKNDEQPPPPEPDQQAQSQEEAEPNRDPGTPPPMSSIELERLLRQLAAKEQEKSTLRRRLLGQRSQTVEKDW